MTDSIPVIQKYLSQFIWAAVWLMGLSVIFVPLERCFALRPQKFWRKGNLVDVGYYFLSSLLPAVMLSVPLAVIAWAAQGFVPSIVLDTTAKWPFWGRPPSK